MSSSASATPSSRQTPTSLLPWLLPWLLLAVAMAWWAWPQQQQRACWMGEWPFEDGCVASPVGADPNQSPQVLADHWQRNIGDSRALAWLLNAWNKEQDERAEQLLPWAVQLAPNQVYVLALQAQQQLQAQDWDAASNTLIAMMERGQLNARPALWALMAAPETQELLLSKIDADALWLDTALATLDGKIPAAAVQPFISRAQELDLLKPATTLALIDRLKREKSWIDAYSLWASYRRNVTPGLYNGSFDRALLRRGFDWEWVTQPSNKQGFRIDQLPASPKAGLMLELDLTGRGTLPTPIIGQTLFLPGRNYVLRGSYMTDRLLSKEGLVWALRCADGGERWAQTTALQETQRQWRAIDLEFSPPPDCGAAVQLRLETSAPWEARAGITGKVFFDDFSISAAPAAQSAND